MPISTSFDQPAMFLDATATPLLCAQIQPSEGASITDLFPRIAQIAEKALTTVIQQQLSLNELKNFAQSTLALTDQQKEYAQILEQENEALNQENQTLRHQCDELVAETSKQAAVITKIAQKSQLIEQNQAEQKRQLNALENQTEMLTKTEALLRKENEGMLNTIAHLNQENQTLSLQSRHIAEKVSELENKTQQHAEQIRLSREENTALQGQLNQAKQNNQELLRSLDALKTQKQIHDITHSRLDELYTHATSSIWAITGVAVIGFSPIGLIPAAALQVWHKFDAYQMENDLQKKVNEYAGAHPELFHSQCLTAVLNMKQ